MLSNEVATTDVGTRNSRGDGDDVGNGYYRRPQREGSRVALNFKVPTHLKAHLQLLMKAWRLRAEVEGAPEDEVEAIDLTFVCNQLLEVGVDGGWEELGFEAGLKGAPQTDAEWAAFRRMLEAKRTK